MSAYSISPDDFSDAEMGPPETPQETAIEKAPAARPDAASFGNAIQQAQEQAIQAEQEQASREALAAKNLTEVLPEMFYAGASELVLTPKQDEILDTLSKPQDDDIDIRPDGFIYISHAFHRDVLTQAFGRGGWAEKEASPIEFKDQGKAKWIYQRWALYVRGANGQAHFVRSCIGAARWFHDSPRANFAEALETVRSDALVRNVAKSSLGVGLEVWSKKRAREWKKKFAIQVKVRARVWEDGGYRWKDELQWRRADGEPLEGEIVEEKKPPAPKQQAPATPKTEGVPTPAVQPSSKPNPLPTPVVQSQPVAPASNPTPSRENPPPATAPAAESRPAPPPETTKPASPPPTEPGMAEEYQIRMFVGLCRRPACKLVEGENAGGAVMWLTNFMGIDPEVVAKAGAGKTTFQVLRGLFKKITQEDFQQRLLPALRRDYPKLGS
jgi:hypothetical protein